jgi:Tfp pilus assembly protein PilX
MSNCGFSDLRCTPVIAGNLGTAQRGVVLLVALIFLVILSLLGVSAMTGTVLETKLAANFQERVYALQVAEAGLAQITPVINNNTQVTQLMGGTPVVAANQTFVRDATHSINSQVENITVSYQGRFLTAPRGSASETNGLTSTDIVYFEVSATGTPNTNDNRVRATLRRGVRQDAPKSD